MAEEGGGMDEVQRLVEVVVVEERVAIAAAGCMLLSSLVDMVV